MIPYFTFEPACNTKETGPVYPQVQKMSPGYDYKAPNSVHALSRAVDKFPDFEPNLDHFIVHGKARLTDLLSVAQIHGGFLISNRLKQILEIFNLVTHRFYPARLLYKKQFFEYYWMHIICDLTSYVDYQRSSFFLYHNYTHNLGYVDINSINDLRNKKVSVKEGNPDKTITIWAEKIMLTEQFDKTLDLFEISTFDAKCYISKSLKDVIGTAGVTGCEIKPAANLLSL